MTENNPEYVTALKKAVNGNEKITVRFRFQRDEQTKEMECNFAIKGKKTNGKGLEVSYPVTVAEGIANIRNFCPDKLVSKMRYVMPGYLVNGIPRTMEFDEFLSMNEGAHVLEIEHKSEQDFIKPEDWQAFALADVTETAPSNKRAARDDVLLSRLELMERQMKAAYQAPGFRGK